MDYVLLLVPFMVGCAAFQQNPKCPDTELIKNDVAYVAEVIATCQGYGGEGEPPVEECPEYPGLQEKYDAKRRQYVECQ